MGIYLVVIAFLLVLIVVYDFTGYNKGRDLCGFIVLLLFICIPSFSRDMGSDTIIYQEWFEREIHTLSHITPNDFTWEPLFDLTFILLKSIWNNWIFAHSVVIALINISIYCFNKRYFKNTFTFLLIYFLLYFYEINFEPLRQSMAMSVFLFSLPLLEKKQYWKYYIMVLISTGFHYSALVTTIFPFITNLKLNNWKTYLGILGLILLGAIIKLKFAELVDFITFSLDYTKYAGHVHEDDALNINGIIGTFGVKMLPVFVAMWIVSKYKSVQLAQIISPISILFVSFMAMRMFIPIIERFTLFYSMAQVGIYADAIIGPKRMGKYNIKRPFLSLVGTAFIAFALMTNLYNYYTATNEFDEPNTYRFIPYKSIFD